MVKQIIETMSSRRICSSVIIEGLRCTYIVIALCCISVAFSSSPVSSASSSPGKPLTMDDLSSSPHTLEQSDEAKEV